MKKMLFIMLFALIGNAYGQTAKFEKPRYLKYATLLTPIDIATLYS